MAAEIKSTIKDGKKVSYTETEIEWDGKMQKVVLKKLKFGEMNDLNQMAARLTYAGGVPKIDFDQKAMNEMCLVKSIIDAPFPINNIEVIRDLDNADATKLVALFNEINQVSDKKKEI